MLQQRNMEHLLRILSVLLFVTSVWAASLHGTSLRPRDNPALDLSPFVRRSLPAWDYTPLKGPLNWHHLSPEYSECANGHNQSPAPFNSSTRQIAPGGLTLTACNVRSAKLGNSGNTVEVAVNGTLTALGRRYALRQFHFHTPSEHHDINNTYSPVEMHLVHRTDDGSNNLAVVGFMIELSEHDVTQFVKNALAPVSSISTVGSEAEIDELDFAEISNYTRTNSFYHYTGSLTVPPCTEGVSWFVGLEPLHMDLKTYNELKKVVRFNSRFIQNAPGQENLIRVACSGVSREGYREKE